MSVRVFVAVLLLVVVATTVATALPPASNYIPNVPDANQPPIKPAWLPGVANYCVGMSAVNITQYWDVVNPDARALNVNGGLAMANAAPFIGWWMDTNNDGCPYRWNGTMVGPPPANGVLGTLVADIAPGLTQYARWDATHDFSLPIAVLPPLPAAKRGYSWTVLTVDNTQSNATLAWGQLVQEIDAGRPLIVCFSYWNPVQPPPGPSPPNPGYGVTAQDPPAGISFYDWGPPAPQSGPEGPEDPEHWNYPDNPDPEHGGVPHGGSTSGHTVTALGYYANYDPDGVGPLPLTNWVIVHDNWQATGNPATGDMAVPWWRIGPGGVMLWSPWVANTTVNLNAPAQLGTLSLAAGPKNPPAHLGWGAGVNIMAQIRFTGGGPESSIVNAVKLDAKIAGVGGTGNDMNDIANIYLVDDSDNDGEWDPTDPTLATVIGGFPADNGTLNININGPLFVVPLTGEPRDMLVAYRMAGAVIPGKSYKLSVTATGISATGVTYSLPITTAGATVTGQKVVIPGIVIAGVPDNNQPPLNPLNIQNFDASGYCGPMSAVNITEYWDTVKLNAKARFVDGNPPPNPLGKNVAQYIGYWMDTDDDGCPFRANGTTRASGGGTYVDDLAAGVIQFVRWDNANGFGCNPPALLAGKLGYNWTVATFHNQSPGMSAQNAWVQMTNEINNGRPLMVTWCYWNPTNPVTCADGVTYYEWGNVQSSSGDPDEEWNHPDNPDKDNSGVQGTPHGADTIGHVTTVVGYMANYDPDGVGPVQAANWVIVHDNWASTAETNMAIPWWRQQAPPGGWSPWVANTCVNPAVDPSVGSLAVANGPHAATNHFDQPGSSVAMAEARLTAANSNVVINAVTLDASLHGGLVGKDGNDQTDIASINIVEDKDHSGTHSIGDVIVATHYGGFPANNGFLTIVIPGPSAYKVIPGAPSDLLVVYNIGLNAQTGATFLCRISDIYATGEITFLPIAPTGLPIIGCTLTPSYAIGNNRLRLGEWKRYADGGLGSTTGRTDWLSVSVDTHVWGSGTYIQEEDRSSGIRIDFGSDPVPTLLEGLEVNIEGIITTCNGERVIIYPQITIHGMGTPPPPVALANHVMGGGNWFYDEVSGAGQKGVLGGVGLNNIGVLVQVCGWVTYVDPTTFTLRIDDGPGPGLKCMAAGFTVNPTWEYVAVTGVSSTEMPGSQLLRVLRPRKLGDVMPLLRPP